jgi:uncharacterized membrane protein
MDRVAIKAHARKAISGKIFTILAITIIVAIIGGILGLVPVVGWLAVIVLEGPIMFAEAKIFLGIVGKNRTPKIEDITEGLKEENFTRSFVGYLRYVVFVTLWSLLLWIPGIIKSISYSQMFFLMADDKKLDAAAAQKKSMEIMKGHKWEYFVLDLSFILWGLLCVVTLGLATIYVAPYVSAAKAEFYRQLKK